MSIQTRINENSLQSINRVNVALINEALHRMKGGETDPLFDFTSDMLINGSPELINHIVNMIKSWLIQVNVPYFLLIMVVYLYHGYQKFSTWVIILSVTTQWNCTTNTPQLFMVQTFILYFQMIVKDYIPAGTLPFVTVPGIKTDT